MLLVHKSEYNEEPMRKYQTFYTILKKSVCVTRVEEYGTVLKSLGLWEKDSLNRPKENPAHKINQPRKETRKQTWKMKQEQIGQDGDKCWKQG